MIKLHQRHRQFVLKAGDAERRVGELDLLFIVAVRRVVTRDDFQRAVGNTLDHRLSIGGRAERRVHLEVRVVFRPGRLVIVARPKDALAVIRPKFIAAGDR